MRKSMEGIKVQLLRPLLCIPVRFLEELKNGLVTDCVPFPGILRDRVGIFADHWYHCDDQ